MSFDCKKSEMSEGDGQVTGDSCPRVQEIPCVCVSVCVIFILYMLFACCSQVHDEIYVVHEPYKINRKQLLWCSVLVNWFSCSWIQWRRIRVFLNQFFEFL